MIEDTKQVLYVWINGKLAFIVSPTWPHPSSPAVAVAQPGGYVGARPPATMDLTPLTGSADAHVFVRTNLNDQPNGGAKLHGYIGCDRWQATITEEGHPRDPGNVYKQVYVLKHNKL